MKSTEAIQAEAQSNVIALKRGDAHKLTRRIVDALTAAGVYFESTLSSTIYEGLEESDANGPGLVQAVLDMAAENGNPIDPKTHGIIESTILQGAGSIAANADVHPGSETPETPKNGPVSASNPSDTPLSPKDASGPQSEVGEAPAGNSTLDMAQAVIDAMIEDNCNATPEQQETIKAVMATVGAMTPGAMTGNGIDLSDAMAAASQDQSFDFSKRTHRASSRWPIDSDPAVEWLVEDVLQKKQITTLSAKGGTGKGNWRTALSLDLANGRSTIGHYIPRKMKILVVMLEDEWETDSDRMHANQSLRSPENGKSEATYDPVHNRAAIDEIMDRVEIYESSADPMGFFDRDPSGKLSITRRINEFIEYVNKGGYDVVIFDPLINLTDGIAGENDNGEMGTVMRSIKRIAVECEVALLLVTHVKHGVNLDGSITPRGASSQLDLARIALSLDYPQEKHLEYLCMTKEEAKAARIRVLDLGKSNHGDDAKDCIYLQIKSVPMQFKGGKTQTVSVMVQFKPVDPMTGINDHIKDQLDAEIAKGFPTDEDPLDDMPRYFYKPRKSSGACKGNLASKVVQDVLPDRSEAAAQNIVKALLRGGNAEKSRWVEGKVPSGSKGNRSRAVDGVMPRSYFDCVGGLPSNDRFTPELLRKAFKAHQDRENEG